ncbi:pentapeptide repeat-containing protein [Streptomyces tibetensis]
MLRGARLELLELCEEDLGEGPGVGAAAAPLGRGRSAFRRCRLRGCSLGGCSLGGCSLRGRSLGGCSLRGRSLRGRGLRGRGRCLGGRG